MRNLFLTCAGEEEKGDEEEEELKLDEDNEPMADKKETESGSAWERSPEFIWIGKTRQRLFGCIFSGLVRTFCTSISLQLLRENGSNISGGNL